MERSLAWSGSGLLWAVLLVCSAGACERAAGNKSGMLEVAAVNATHREPEEPPKSSTDGVLRISREQVSGSGISVVVAAPGTIESGVELLGEVRPNEDRLAEIAPRFSGIVREVRKNVGDVVRSGESLAVIESDNLSPFEMKTLIDGVVLEKHITRGEAVDRGERCFTVADLGTVWVDLSVYQKDLAEVSVGQPVRVSAGEGGVQAEGMISYVTPSVDSATRTATARVILPNAERAWRPGLFVTARLLSEASAQVTIPKSALQTVEGQTCVFVETAEGFEARPVEVGREGDRVIEVVSGLAPGERIAAENAFLLKAELGKSEAEHED